MFENHYYTLHGVCPCKIGEESVKQAAEIFHGSPDVSSFVAEMEKRRVIGRKISYDEQENTIFLTMIYASDCGGGCPENDSLIGQRCHCGHYNKLQGTYPKHYCKCTAEYHRPMFGPLFGADVLIEPFKTVLAGDEECIIAVRLDRKENGK